MEKLHIRSFPSLVQMDQATSLKMKNPVYSHKREYLFLVINDTDLAKTVFYFSPLLKYECSLGFNIFNRQFCEV